MGLIDVLFAVVLAFMVMSGYFIAGRQSASGEPVYALVTDLVATVFFAILVGHIYDLGAGRPTDGGDTAKEVTLTQGKTYTVVFQAEDGRHTLLKTDEGVVRYHSFSGAVPKKFYVDEKRKISSLEK